MEAQSNLDGIIGAIEAGNLKTMTSFSRMYEQSKSCYARAWARRDVLELPQKDAVERYLPETYDFYDIPASRLISERGEWVIKRALGRVGDEVWVGAVCEREVWPGVVAEVARLCGQGEKWIVQRYVGQRTVITPWGPIFVTLGAYVLDGRFVGYFARLTEVTHVSHDALCVPVFVEAA
jgi:hypothetical protein